MIETVTKPLTLDAFLQLPETKPAQEYIQGRIIQKPMPQGKHSKLQGKLVTVINELVEMPKIALAFPELRCTFGDRSIVPDITVFTWQRIPIDEEGDIANNFNTYPDWTIEILSPEQNQTKVTSNILHCLQHGTALGWLIDPKEKSILVFPSQQQPKLFIESTELLIVPNWIEKLHLTTADVFGWLRL